MAIIHANFLDNDAIRQGESTSPLMQFGNFASGQLKAYASHAVGGQPARGVPFCTWIMKKDFFGSLFF